MNVYLFLTCNVDKIYLCSKQRFGTQTLPQEKKQNTTERKIKKKYIRECRCHFIHLFSITSYLKTNTKLIIDPFDANYCPLFRLLTNFNL